MTPYSEAEVRELLSKGEGQFLEFKSLWDREGRKPRPLRRRKVRDWIVEYVAAFANADGGTVILGAEDDGTPTGHGYPGEAISEFISVPERRLRPPIRIRSQQIIVDGMQLILFQVPMAIEAVMVDGNGFPYRVGDQVIYEPQEVINERKQTYRRVGYEQRVDSEVTLENIDLELARRFLSGSPLRERPIEEILSEYGLLHWKAGKHAVTNAALLLFGRPPFTQWHPRAGIRFFRVHGTERKHGKERNVAQLVRLEPPVAVIIEEAHRATAGQIRKSEKLHNLFFREMPEYPTFVWQEAIVNAVAHRDYNDQGREIEITFFEDHMEIVSPGELIPPVTLEALRQRRRIHASRNPLLVRVLVDVGIMREEGEGIPRMFEEMEESLLNAPQFETENSTFIVRLLNEPVFEGAVVEWKAIVEQLNLSINQKRALLAYPDGFSNEEYRSLSNLDRDQAYREINEMVSMVILQPPSSSGRGAFYHISSDLEKSRGWLAERLPRLEEFFNQHRSLKNSDYRCIFQVTRIKAFRELRRLVEEGILDKEGERKGTVYKPGPWFKERKIHDS